MLPQVLNFSSRPCLCDTAEEVKTHCRIKNSGFHFGKNKSWRRRWNSHFCVKRPKIFQKFKNISKSKGSKCDIKFVYSKNKRFTVAKTLAHNHTLSANQGVRFDSEDLNWSWLVGRGLQHGGPNYKCFQHS